MLKPTALSWLVCCFSLCVAFSTHVLAQAAPTSEIGVVALDRDRAVAPRWARLDFDPLVSGTQTIQLAVEGDADIRFSVFNARTRSVVDGNLVGQWTGDLDIAESYYLGIWSVSGVADVIATIEAKPIGEGSGLTFASQPEDTAVVEGSDAFFSVAIEGTEPLSYQWFVGDTAIVDATSSTLVVRAVSDLDNGAQLSVQVSDGVDTIQSDSVTLTVLSSDEGLPSITIGEGTLDANRVSGPRITRINFDSLGSALHTISVSWDSGADIRFNVFDSQGTRLSRPVVSGTNPGVWSGDLEADEQYTLSIWSSDGLASFSARANAEVSTQQLAFATQPTNLAVYEGDDASFTASASGSTPLTYQWFVSTTQIDTATGDTIVNAAEPIEGATNNTLLLESVMLSDNASIYYASVADSEGNEATSDSSTLTVRESPTSLSIVSQPLSLTVAEGDEANFSISATGSALISYQWFVDDIAIDGATSANLNISPVSALDSGNRYSVRIGDDIETVLSDSATLTVDTADEPFPSVVFGQGALDSDRDAGPSFMRLYFDSFGAALHTISVAWDGDADIRFNVFEPGGARLNNEVIRGQNPGVWSGVLDANQQYSIAIWSFDGIANFTASVDASSELAIAIQPNDLVVSVGDSATFTVKAIGSGTISYQWFEDGEPLAGENTDTLFIQTPSIADTGKTYTVDVFNQAADTESSDGAVLTVLEPFSSTERYFHEADTSAWMLNGPAPTLDFLAGADTDGWGRALLRMGDVLLVGGDFQGLIPTANSSNQTNRPWLAALDAVSGQPVSSFAVPQEVNSVVRSLALSPDASQVYVGGDFGLLALDTLTGEFIFEVPVSDGNGPGRVFDILVTETQLYIGGEFSEVMGSPRRNLARLSLLGELDVSWSPRVSGGVSRGRSAPVQSLALSPTGNSVYVGGTYTSIDDAQVPTTERGTTVSMLAISTDDGSVNPERFVPELVLGEFEDSKDLIVHDIAMINSYIIIAWGGPNYLTLHQLDGTRIQQYSGPGDVQAIQVLGDLVIVGHHGEFLGTLTDPIPPQAVLSVEPVVVEPFKLHTFRLDPVSDRLVPEQTWPINGTFGVWAIAASEDSIWIAGNLRRAGTNNLEVEGLARFPATE